VVTVLALLGVVLVLFVAAVVATREDQAMADAPQDLPDLMLPAGPLEPQDVAAVRFSMAPRGYRMSEVDAVLERLAAELADRDQQLAELVGHELPDDDGGPRGR
jgi:DivIVA domain-containing protein